ncbi:acyltransferase [Gloeocapsopsis sp. IPPAS B-1203]|uniref:acyltransferase n=1 Tax=Gloeocapsopsis sp. IPPAS B-1203 TaxID=2049454 RepID=UPI000C19E70B|nr:acyltransferase [Gloeocapsopsis sp. IPPAS B-1203]PIG91048.1 transferase [Gloeocapsopsis sp. IPPAS B-1203]
MPTYLPHDWFSQPLPSNVILGEQSWLYSTYAFLHYRSQRACGLRVGHNTGIYIDTLFDLGPSGEVEIGNYCTLAGPIIATNGHVKIGDYVLISREVVLADSFAAVPPTIPQRSTSQSSILIGNDVWIGTRAVILSGARLGDGAIVGAGAVVDFEIPEYAIAAGNPARIVGWAYPD